MTKKYTRGNQDVDTSFLTLEMTWHGINDKRVKDQVGSTSPDSVLEIIKGKTITYLVDDEQFKPFILLCAKALLNNKELLENLKQNTIKTAKQIRELARKNIEKIHTLSDKGISKLFIEIKKLQAECAMFGTVVAFADIDGGITNKLIEIIKKRKNLKHPIHIYTTVLGNPSEKSITGQAYNYIKQNKDKIIAIGEVDLDFSEGKESGKKQKEIFQKVIQLAEEIKKPLIVHTRKAEEDCIEMLESSGLRNVVFHCFTGNFKLVKKIEDKNWFLSIPPIILRSLHFQGIVQNVSISNLLTETDSPYLAPPPKTRNEPAFVKFSVERISEIKNLTIEETKNLLFKNFQNVFLKQF